MKIEKIEILVIEDDQPQAELIKEMLANVPRQQYAVTHLNYLALGLEALKEQVFDCVMVDLGLPDSQGLETALSVRRQAREVPIVVLTVLDDEEVAMNALKMDIQDYLIKGEINTALLTRSIRYAIQRKAVAMELESFNYTVAHDLRQPLNLLYGYCQGIDMLCGSELGEDCRHYLADAYRAIKRMTRLLDSLLEFSRMSRRELRRARVDLSALARGIASDLKKSAPDRAVTFAIAEGIEVDADPGLMEVVLQNLIGNAWKYTQKQEEANIEVGHARVEGKRACYVRDNGPGFEQTEADKLFRPFQRLPGAERSQGFGIGLATVERIVTRHGGRAWAEGAPGKGATFYFTLDPFP